MAPGQLYFLTYLRLNYSATCIPTCSVTILKSRETGQYAAKTGDLSVLLLGITSLGSLLTSITRMSLDSDIITPTVLRAIRLFQPQCTVADTVMNLWVP
jgi:hypothetical protein